MLLVWLWLWKDLKVLSDQNTKLHGQKKTWFNITPNIQKQHVLRETARRTIVFLRLDEGFDKRVRRLRVERESVSQRLQLWTLLQERVFQSVASRMEVLFDRIQGSF